MRYDVKATHLVGDGRILEKVSIAAGSRALGVADGSRFVAADVGKQIAVPGAVDLVATIVELLRRRRIRVSTTAGSNELQVLAWFVDENDPAEPIRNNLDGGWRITVDGADDAGETMLSTVVTIDGNQLELADNLGQTIDTVATLNDPSGVRLDDHARAEVGTLTVDLGDRSVVDAKIIVGSKVLRSGAARFSSLDLTKVVRLTAAGCLVSVIDAVVDDRTVELTDAAAHPVTDGGADVWHAEHAVDIQTILATISAQGTGPAEIVFGPGVYDFLRIPEAEAEAEAEGSMPAAIGLEGLTNLTLRGAGAGTTVLRLMPQQDLRLQGQGTVLDTHVLMARDCRALTLRDLTVHGAYLTMWRSVEQMHGVNINQGCEDVVLDRVAVVQSAGDGVRLLGQPDNPVSRVWITGCRLLQNRRTGIAFQRSVGRVWVRDCYLEMTPPSSGSGIDFEPSGGAPTDVIIDSNILVHDTDGVAVSLSGVSHGPPARRIRFSGNTLTGGGIGGVNARDVTIVGNTIDAGGSLNAMTFQGNFANLRIEDNRISATGDRDGIHMTRNPGGASGVRITGNDIATGGNGIDVTTDGSGLEVRNNRINGASIGIRVQVAGASVHHDLRIAGNTVTDFGLFGIRLIAGQRGSTDVDLIDGAEIRDNDLSVTDAGPQPTTGISLDGRKDNKPWMSRLVLTGNRINDQVTTPIARPADGVPITAIAGNPLDRAILDGFVSPDHVVAPPGSLYIYVTTGGASTVHVKSTGTDATGWHELG